MLPPQALRDRPLLTGVAVLGLANALVTPALMLAAWYLQAVAGLGAAASGLLFVPFNLAGDRRLVSGRPARREPDHHDGAGVGRDRRRLSLIITASVALLSALAFGRPACRR